jgi:hypothetical protein
MPQEQQIGGAQGTFAVMIGACDAHCQHILHRLVCR